MDKLETLRTWAPGQDFLLKLKDFKLELRSYQKVAAAYAYYAKRCVLGDPTGVGKTVEALAVCHIASEQDNAKNVLIITPYSRKQWVDEIKRFLNWDTLVVEAAKAKRKMFWKEARHNFFTVINYHTLVSDIETILALHWDAVIYDEATAFKNPSTVRYGAVNALTERVSSSGGWILGLSATPMEGRFEDLWGVFNGIGVNKLGTFENYVRKFCVTETFSIWNWRNFPKLKNLASGKFCPTCGSKVYFPFISCDSCHTYFKWEKKIEKVVGCKDPKALKEVLKDHFIMRSKASLLPELPPVIIKNVILPFSTSQRAAYDSLEHDMHDPLALCTYQSECCDDPALVKKKGDSAKFDWIKEAVEGQLKGEKVVYFTKFHHCVDKIFDVLTKAGCNPVKITGKESFEQREVAKKTFWDDPKCKALIGTQAIEKSINLQVSGILVAVDVIPNPARHVQLIGRIERMGSQHSTIVNINLIMENSYDSEIWDIIEEKIGNIQDIFGEDSMKFNFDAEAELIKRRQSK